MGAARLFACKCCGDEDAGESKKIGGFKIIDGYAFDVSAGKGMEGGAKIGGVALDAGVGPEQGLEFEAGDRGGLIGSSLICIDVGVPMKGVRSADGESD